MSANTQSVAEKSGQACLKLTSEVLSTGIIVALRDCVKRFHSLTIQQCDRSTLSWNGKASRSLYQTRRPERKLHGLSSNGVVILFVSVSVQYNRLVSVAHWHSACWAWNGYQPGLGSIPRPGRINCFRITGAHALRLISRTGKRVW